MALRLKRGAKVHMKGRVVTVTDTAYECLPRVRDRLIEVAMAGGKITYGELRDELDLPYVPHGMGRLLDLLWEECSLRNEPSLASVVVSQSTGEVGSDFGGDAEVERRLVYAQKHWS